MRNFIRSEYVALFVGPAPAFSPHHDGQKDFLRHLTKVQSMMLGMGQPSHMPHEPSKTGFTTLNFKTILNLQFQIFKAIGSRLVHNLKLLLSDKTKRLIQKIYKKSIKVNTD